jgi:proline iminopeptidase
MTDLYPEIEPHDYGMLEVGDANRVYWEVSGNPEGKPAIVLHGGPGSGCTAWHRRLFDPAAYRLVLFDQRGCGRSRPHASAIETDLATNNTPNLIADVELLRRHLDVERWLVCDGSWGSTLALAYSETHPDRVTEMILFGVTTGRRKEFDWTFRGGMAVLFPEQWDRLRAVLPATERNDDIVEAYQRLLHDPDPTVRQQAADSWCLWESATPAWPPTSGLSPRFADPAYRMAFARLVTHYVRHNAWIDDESLLRHAGLLADIPGILVHGRFDLQGPLANAWELHRVWPCAELVIVPDAGHAANHPGLVQEIVRATDRFAASH